MDKEALINAFFNFDHDKDGYISCEDLMVAMMTKGAKMSAEEVSHWAMIFNTQAQAFVTEVDFDKDGHVYYPEVVEYLISAMEDWPQ